MGKIESQFDLNRDLTPFAIQFALCAIQIGQVAIWPTNSPAFVMSFIFLSMTDCFTAHQHRKAISAKKRAK